MAITYPGTIDTFTDPAGTSYLTSPDHAGQHTDSNDAITAIENVLGTTAGTSVLKNFGAGNFAEREGTLTFGSARYSLGTGLATNDYLKYNGTSIIGGTVSASGGATDGWSSASGTWSYASGTTITVPSGAASIYGKGDKIKIDNPTTKYFYITSVADTVLTVNAGTNYTVGTGAISAAYYSHESTPLGFTQWFGYQPTITPNAGTWSATVSISQYTIVSKSVVWTLQTLAETVTGSPQQLTVTLPVPSQTLVTVPYQICGLETDGNGSALYTLFDFYNNTTSFYLKTANGSAYRNGGYMGFTLTYPLG